MTWAGLQSANPWWDEAQVPVSLAPRFEREAVAPIFAALQAAEPGRGLVVLGPRRVGKSTIAYQIVRKLLAAGVAAHDVCFMAFDDPALKFEPLGSLLDLYEARVPKRASETRYLILDEVQFADDWALWLKRLADRKLPYRFLATGSAATALKKGGAPGLGRWRELVLYPFSFREFTRLRGAETWTFKKHDAIEAIEARFSAESRQRAFPFAAEIEALEELGPPPADETARLQSALEEYLLRGGFPELARVDDLREARRRLRQDILERALGRDLLDVAQVDDPRTLERMFLRICRSPGCLWNETDVSKDLGITRPTVTRYLRHLEDSYLVFRLPNLARRERGQPKIYLVDSALRQALLGIDRAALVQPEIYGPVLENAVASALMASRPAGASVGFWRDGKWECDAVLEVPGTAPWLYEVKRSADARHDLEGLRRAGEALAGPKGPFVGALLHGGARGTAAIRLSGGHVVEQHPATWLYTFHPPQ